MAHDRAQMRRVFEETITRVMAESVPTDDVLVEAQALNDQGQQIVVARYRLCADGRIECFEILDDVLWPSV
jgi:hypothetical protein